MSNWNPETTPNFTFEEMSCRCENCGGEVHMRQEFMEKLQAMRTMLGPIKINSGYRCRKHPDEAKKDKPGAHNQGRAADIATADGYSRYKVLHAAFAVGMQGTGVANSFIHVDDGHDFAPRPTQWKYS